MLHKLIEGEGDTIGKSGKAYIVNKDGLLLTIPKFMREDAGKKISSSRNKLLPNPSSRPKRQTPECWASIKTSAGKMS